MGAPLTEDTFDTLPQENLVPEEEEITQPSNSAHTERVSLMIAAGPLENYLVLACIFLK